MPNVTYTPSAPFEDANKAMKRVITVHVDGHYEDTMLVSAYASDKEIADLYQQRLIDAEETKLAWGW
jgi:serine protease inhibitor ecotin